MAIGLFKNTKSIIPYYKPQRDQTTRAQRIDVSGKQLNLKRLLICIVRLVQFCTRNYL